MKGLKPLRRASTYTPFHNAQKRLKQKALALIIIPTIFGIIIALGIGLGLSLTRSTSSTNSGTPPSYDNENATSTSVWQPAAGTSWQIVLLYPLNDTLVDADVYDIDLFTNSLDMISSLQASGKKVICYFSAGSYENFRPDSDLFNRSDYGKPLEGWPGEWWLDTNSANVRSIMQTRLDLAVQKGCDGVDPDNVDGFDNDTGFDLTQETGIEYVTFLATEAHNRNMSIGLKNSAEIVNQTLDMMQWEVNEQCEEYEECSVFQPFINAGKPVFHIEYPLSAPNISGQTKTTVCDSISAEGFSTIMKNMDLDDWVEFC